MATNTLLRAARLSSGLSRKQLSGRSGITEGALSQIERGTRNPTFATLNRALRSTGHSLITIPTLRDDVASIATSMSEALREGRSDRAARDFIQANDNLVAEHGAVRFALALTEPERTGLKHWDAALAGLAAYRLREEGLPLPAWVVDPDRALKRAWTFTAGTYVIAVDRERVPLEFLERGVLIDPATLESV